MRRGPFLRRPSWAISGVPRPASLIACAGILLGLLIFASCSVRNRAASTVRLTIATGRPTGQYYPLGQALARIYSRSFPEVSASAQRTTGSVFNAGAVEKGSADLAFIQEDVAYFAFRHGTRDDPQPHRRLRALAALWVNAVQVAVRREGPVLRVADLRGRRIAVGGSSSGTRVVANVILKAQGLDGHVKLEPLSFRDSAPHVRGGDIDGAFVLSSSRVPAIAQLNTVVGLRLLPIDGQLAGRLRANYPFFRPIVIPGGTYAGQTHDVPTVSVGNLLVCRAGLPDQLVYRLTRTFIESLSDLGLVHAHAASIDPEQARTTAIPLHAGAAWFYRERELVR